MKTKKYLGIPYTWMRPFILDLQEDNSYIVTYYRSSIDVFKFYITDENLLQAIKKTRQYGNKLEKEYIWTENNMYEAYHLLEEKLAKLMLDSSDRYERV